MKSNSQGLTLRISLTDRCQLACAYCQPDGGCLGRSGELSAAEVVRFVERIAATGPIDKIRITGGEPLIRKDIPEIIGHLTALGDFDVGLTTNGQLLAGYASALADAGLKRINVSLDSICPTTFRRLTGGGKLERTLSGLDAAKSAGMAPIKLNMVAMRNLNFNEVDDLLLYAGDNGFELRFLELMPIGIRPEEFERYHVPADEILARLSTAFKLDEMPFKLGSTSRRYSWSGKSRSGTLGVISAVSKPFCGSCRRLRLTSQGELIGCLAKQDRTDIRSMLQGEAHDFHGIVQSALAAKRARPEFSGREQMARIGG